MTAEQFRDRVISQEQPGLPKKSLTFAEDFFVAQGQTNEGNLKACIELAGRFTVSAYIVETAPEVTQAFSISVTPMALITSEKWAQELRPWVEAVRQEIFGSPLPPFKTHEDAAKSLAGTGKDAQVNKASGKIAEQTGFTQAAVAAYILTGVITPFVSSAEIHVQNITCAMPMGGIFKRPQAALQINWGTVPPEQFKGIHRELRKALKISKGKQFTARDQRLLDMVQRLGGEPVPGKKAFWENVRQEWNKAVGREKYTTWRGLEIKYRRLQKKLATYQ